MAFGEIFLVGHSGQWFILLSHGASHIMREILSFFRGPPSAVVICKPPSLKSCNRPAYQVSCLRLLHENLPKLPSAHTKITVYNSQHSALPYSECFSLARVLALEILVFNYRGRALCLPHTTKASCLEFP